MSTFTDCITDAMQCEEKGDVEENEDLAKTYYQQACDSYRKASEIKPDSGVFYNWGRICFILAGHCENDKDELDYKLESARHFEDARSLDSDNPEVLFNLARTYSSVADIEKGSDNPEMEMTAAGRLEKSAELFQEAAKLYGERVPLSSGSVQDSESPITESIVADCYAGAAEALADLAFIKEGFSDSKAHFAKACELIEKAYCESPCEDHLITWADILQSSADLFTERNGTADLEGYVKAISKLDEAIEVNESNWEAWEQKGDIHVKLANLCEAESAKPTKGKQPEISDFTVEYQLNEACQAYLKVDEMVVNSVHVKLRLGDIAIQESRLKTMPEEALQCALEADKWYKKASILDSTSWKSMQKQALVSWMLGKYKEAKRLWKDAKDLGGNHEYVEQELGIFGVEFLMFVMSL